MEGQRHEILACDHRHRDPCLRGQVRADFLRPEYNHYDRTIIEPILEALAQDRPEIVGISMVRDEPQGVRPNVRFAKEPYIVTTFLIEDSEGNLIPQLSRS